AEAAERIADGERARFEPHPEVRDPAAVAAARRRAGVVARRAADHGIGLALALGEETRHVVQIVLPVGIDLQRVREAALRRFAQAVEHRGAFAAVRLDPQHVETVRDEPLDHRAGGGAMVIAGHDGAGAEAHRKSTVPLHTGRRGSAYAKRRLERAASYASSSVSRVSGSTGARHLSASMP